MIEGRLKVSLDEKKIAEILPYSENSVGDCIVALNVWAIPHWNEVISVSLGAIKINKTTAEAIIGRLKLINNNNQEVIMAWLNWGWSINEKLADWECEINFHKINYKER